MRALLVVNPAATTTSSRRLEVLVRALGSDLKLDVATTQRRWHAAELAAQARADGIDLVVAVGGDGTVNEVVNGLLADGVEGAPALAVVPGGSTNVFARAVGMPVDLVEATASIMDAVRVGRRRRIGLGQAHTDGSSRWFTFCAGTGLDAEVVAQVERQRARGRGPTPALFLGLAIRQFYAGGQRRHPALTLHRPGREPITGLHFGIVCNTRPWTYWHERPIVACPDASFEAGLDLFGLRRMRTASAVRHAWQILRTANPGPRGRDVVLVHDADAFTLTADRPLAFQLDGDALGTRTAIRFTATRDALDVLV